jgi:hypothetical protein
VRAGAAPRAVWALLTSRFAMTSSENPKSHDALLARVQSRVAERFYEALRRFAAVDVAVEAAASLPPWSRLTPWTRRQLRAMSAEAVGVPARNELTVLIEASFADAQEIVDEWLDNGNGNEDPRKQLVALLGTRLVERELAAGRRGGLIDEG